MTMTAEEFRESIAKLGLKQVDAAKLLGKNDRTIRRWLVIARTSTTSRLRRPSYDRD